MTSDKDNHDKLRALTPFTIGEAEILLVPNKLNGAEPTVLLIARHQASTISNQLTLAEMRQLAGYLNVVADEAEALASLELSPCAANSQSYIRQFAKETVVQS